MKVISFAVLAMGLSACASCARFQPSTPAVSPSDYTLSGVTQSVTMKDSSIRYDPTVLKPGNTRDQVQATFGDANASRTTDTGLIEDVYAFDADGSKYVNPQVRPRNVALAFFTMGTSIAVRQARLALAERKLTLYHVLYSSDDRIQSVREEKMAGAPANGPAGQAPAANAPE